MDLAKTYYKLNFSLMQYHKYSLTEIENMIPWERDIYVGLLRQHLEEEELKRNQQRANGSKRLTATIDKDTKQLLINDFGYEPVDLESYTGQIRALKESFNTLQISNPKDPRLIQLQIAVKDLRADREIEKDTTGTLKKTRKRRKDAKTPEQVKAEIDAKDKAIADRKAKKKKDAMNFISPGNLHLLHYLQQRVLVVEICHQY